MGIPVRDTRSVLSSNGGQAIVEYILILVVVVGLALGVVYQFNSAFKSYLQNYFGEYVACLLETGELPLIDAAPGDTGVCSQLFKPFTLADGKPLIAPGSSTNPNGSDGKGTGSRETGRGGNSGTNGGNFSGSSRFGGGGGSSGSGGFSKKGDGKEGAYTGSTTAGGYGGGYSATNKKLDTGLKYRVDNKFAFEDEKEGRAKRPSATVTRSTASQDERGGTRARLKRKEISKDSGEGGEVGFTIGNFLRYLIIAAIVISLVFFLGSQMLQVSKSME